MGIRACLVLRAGDQDMVRLLLENGADINCKDYHENSPLSMFLHGNCNKEQDMMRLFLLENGTDINQAWGKESDKKLPLF